MNTLAAILAFLACRGPGPVVPKDTRQLVVGLAPDWSAQTAVLYRFERGKDKRWRRVGKSWDANLGKNGLAVGRGLVDFCADEGMRKVEGDRKTPAGIFPIGGIYGFDGGYRKSVRKKMTLINDTMSCIEDPKSSHYNEIVDTATTAPVDWEWAAMLKKEDARKSRVIVIGHNGGADPAHVKPEKDAGSCVLFHVEKKGRPTFGCTSQSEHDIDTLITWLDRKKHPVYVLLTAAQYRALAKDKTSGLPRIK